MWAFLHDHRHSRVCDPVAAFQTERRELPLCDHRHRVVGDLGTAELTRGLERPPREMTAKSVAVLIAAVAHASALLSPRLPPSVPVQRMRAAGHAQRSRDLQASTMALPACTAAGFWTVAAGSGAASLLTQLGLQAAFNRASVSSSEAQPC